MTSASRRRVLIGVVSALVVGSFAGMLIAGRDRSTHTSRAPSVSRRSGGGPVARSARPTPPVDPIPISARHCLERPPIQVTLIQGSVPGEYRVDAPPTEQTFDARSATFIGDGTVPPAPSTPQIYPLLLGKATPSVGICVVGGAVPGTLDRAMTWPQLKGEKPQADGRREYFDAAALTVFARGDEGHLVDGFRVDNVSDGVAARGSYAAYGKVQLDGNAFYLRNAYFTFVHDDCVDVNDLISGIVYDSLFDGCYTGVSERPNHGSQLLKYHAAHGQQFVLDHVLMHMSGFPGPHRTHACPTGTSSGYNEMFKWSPNANELLVRDSVFLIDRAPCSTRYFPFPKHAKLRNVTIVWAGHGRWKWSQPPGLRVSTDRSIWNKARVAWLRRHGCLSTTTDIAATSNRCTNLTDPTP